MEQAKSEKNWLVNLGFICLSYAILVTILGYFTINYKIDFLKNSFLFQFYFSLDNSFAGYLISGTWAFLDVFVVVTVFSIFYYLSEKLISSIDKNA